MVKEIGMILLTIGVLGVMTAVAVAFLNVLVFMGKL